MRFDEKLRTNDELYSCHVSAYNALRIIRAFTRLEMAAEYCVEVRCKRDIREQFRGTSDY